jgi:hypothetical protein
VAHSEEDEFGLMPPSEWSPGEKRNADELDTDPYRVKDDDGVG